MDQRRLGSLARAGLFYEDIQGGPTFSQTCDAPLSNSRFWSGNRAIFAILADNIGFRCRLERIGRLRMHMISKLIAAGAAGLIALGMASAIARSDRDDRSDRNATSFSYQVNDENRRNTRKTRRSWRQDNYVNPDQVVNRRTYFTQYEARIVLTESLVRTRIGPGLVCTVEARGPEADYISKRRLRRLANNDCSRRSRIRILA